MVNYVIGTNSATFYFIDFWIKRFDQNDIKHSNMYNETMKVLFEKILVELPKLQSLKEKRQSLLHAIGVDWYMKKMSSFHP